MRAVLDALGPLVLVVEDLHWADDATRDLLWLLARDLPRQTALLLTYRAEDLPASTPVLGAAFRPPAGTTSTELHLGALTEAQTRELAVAALGGRATGALCRQLYERSAGLPW